MLQTVPTGRKLTYEEFHYSLFDRDDIAQELGYDWFEDLSYDKPDVAIYINNRIAELWINYKADELV